MSEQVIEEGRAVQELQRTAGWKILRSKLQEEKDRAIEEMRQIDIEDRTLEAIGADFIRIQKLIDGLSRPEEIITEILEAYENHNE